LNLKTYLMTRRIKELNYGDVIKRLGSHYVVTLKSDRLIVLNLVSLIDGNFFDPSGDRYEVGGRSHEIVEYIGNRTFLNEINTNESQKNI